MGSDPCYCMRVDRDTGAADRKRTGVPDGLRTKKKEESKMKKTKKSDYKIQTKLFALMLTVAAIISCLAIPVSAKGGGFRYYVSNGLAVVTGYTSRINGTLSVPATIAGYTVDAVAPNAFYGRTDITQVVLPDNWITVCESAFANCTNLQTLNVGKCFILTYAFAGCRSLRNVNIRAARYEFLQPEYDWADEGNDPLHNASWNWTRYQNTVFAADYMVRTTVGRRLTLTAGYNLRQGEQYHWFYNDECVFEPDADCWEFCTGKTLRGCTVFSGTGVVTCEVTDRTGAIVWAQNFCMDVHSASGR